MKFIPHFSKGIDGKDKCNDNSIDGSHFVHNIDKHHNRGHVYEHQLTLLAKNNKIARLFVPSTIYSNGHRMHYPDKLPKWKEHLNKIS